MAMAFSTHTSPFKPSFAPYCWLCSSSCSFRTCSTISLFRQPVFMFRSAKNHFLNVNVIIGSVRMNQSSNYSNIPFDRNSIFKSGKKIPRFSMGQLQEMEDEKLIRRPASSDVRESSRYFPNHNDWLEHAQIMRDEKMKISLYNNNINSNNNNEDTSGLLASGRKDKLENILDKSAHDNINFHTLELVNVGKNGASENLSGPGPAYEYRMKLKSSSLQQKPNNQGQRCDAENEANGSTVYRASGLVSGKQGYRKTDCRSRQNACKPKLSNPGQKHIPSTHLPREVSQPDGSHTNGRVRGSSDICEDKVIPRTQKDLAAETYIEEINMEKALGIDHRESLGRIYEKVLVVDNISVAKEIAWMLTNEYRDLVHACDTEVAKIDVKQETPIDHGEIICFSIYCGPKANFGNGKSCIWVDVLDGGGRSMLAVFAPFFEDPSIKKVWHNYSFDKHVIENYGVKVSGFHADTMHMARLWNSSRRTEGGYSLEALTGDPKVMSGARLGPDEKLIGKVSMKTIFGRKKVKKDGSEGKLTTIPPVEELQKTERTPWICYSALDSISTLKLYESLERKLSSMDWNLDGVKKGNMYEFYKRYWRPFGELLVEMETEGMLVDRAFLADIEKVAKAEQQIAADRFRNWASKYCSDAKHMNVGSDAQLRQLFFGGIQNSKDPNETLPVKREFKIPNVDKVIEEGKKAPTKFRNITLHKIGDQMQTESYTASGWPSISGEALKALAGKVSAEYNFTDETHELQPDENIEMTETEVKEEDHTEAPDISAYGTAYAAFSGGLNGIEACHAIASLCEVCSIDSLISNFILPLQGSNVSGKNGRIHCSLNINTETGRLSARRPNLQNQPALEKDRYKIRQAFIATPGNSLIVADYGQLELRILAHLANCKSMLDAFKAGGDFHSRTAMNMYPYIRDAVEQKDVLLEWQPKPGEDKPPVSLLKDAFASERRKAKMLNFSIAYGKTTMGLARDWKVSVVEAKETVDRWYSERAEVLKWQEMRKAEARSKGCVHTLLGRARKFPSIKNATYSQKGHIERAAINTPVQGSAADVAMCAMLEIARNARLKQLGWRLLLQVHDEVILEGPRESAEVAKSIVVECMSKPFAGKNILKVDLAVDAKFAQNWYSAK